MWGGRLHSLGTLAPFVIALALVLAFAASAQADNLAYVRASSQLAASPTSERYHPLNLLDDNPATIWCEASEGMGEDEEIRIYFKHSQRIDRVVITPAVTSGRIIESVRVTDGLNTVRLGLGEQQLSETLDRPLEGATYVVILASVGAPNKASQLGADVACLADVVLYYKGQPFGGKTPLDKLRFDKQRDRILGRWSGAPLGAPEKFLVFAFDGTWEWTFSPLLGGKKETAGGEYRFRGDRLLMRKGEAGRWADVSLSVQRVRVDPNEAGAPRSDYDVLRLNNLIGDRVGGEYNDAVF